MGLKTVTIDVFGHPFVFKPEDDLDAAEEIAALLSSEIKKVEKKMSTVSPKISREAVLIMAALNITKEYFELKRNYSSTLDDLTKKSAVLSKMLDSTIQ